MNAHAHAHAFPLQSSEYRDMALPPAKPNFAAAIYQAGEWAAREMVRRHQIDRGLRVIETGTKIELPAAERGRSAFDLRELDKINARLARGYKSHRGKTADEQRDDDIRRRAALETKGKDRPTETRTALTLIMEHDPLVSLTWLTKDQFEAGRALRGFYANQGGDISCAEITGMPSGGHKHEQFVASRAARALETAKIQWVISAILIGQFRNRFGSLCPVEAHARFVAEGVQPHVALRVMRDICEHEKTLSSLGAGRAYDRHRKALALALDVAHEVLHG